MSTAREEILGRVRAALSGADRPRVDRDQPAPGVPELPAEREALAAAFVRRAESVGARVQLVDDVAAAGAALAERLDELGVRQLALSDGGLVARVAESLPAQIERFVEPSRAELLAADAGLSGAQLGIAETGTLVLVGEHERHRLTSLLPPAHVALLALDDLLGSLDEALARLAPAGQDPAACITFITGPSRTADIELQLVVGVHGPRSLDVILLRSPA